MKTIGLKIGGAFSLMMASTLMVGCGASDSGNFDGAQSNVVEEGDHSDDVELGSIEQGLHSCSNPDGTNAVMAALAVAAGHDLGRWRAGIDFEVYPTNGAYENQYGTWSAAIRLTSGTGSDGQPRGKSRCSGGVCKRVQPLLLMQYDNAANQVYVQAETSTSKVLVNPSALRSRMVAKLQEQITKDRDMKDGDTYQVPKTPHTLTGAGMANLNGCGPHYKFNVAFAPTSTTPKPLPAQLKWSLSFADQQNGWVDFRDLGNNVVAIDPTYGLNEEDTSSAGTCTAACTKVSSTSLTGQCCSCGGVNKTFRVSTFSTAVYLCQ